MTKVPVGAVTAEAYRALLARSDQLLELAWLPFLLVLAARLVPDLIALNAATPIGRDESDLVLLAVSGVAFSAFAVRWHHVMMFPDPRAVPPGLFRSAWARFLLYCLAFSLVPLTMVGLPPGEAPVSPLAVIQSLASLAAAVVCLRTMLMFPAAAYGQPLGPLRAWRLLRGNTWRLIAASLLTALPVLAGDAIVVAAALTTLHRDAQGALVYQPSLAAIILQAVLGTATSCLSVALGATILSLFYRRIVLGAR